MTAAAKTLARQKEVALLGNPNCGKTTIFNALTGLRFTTANYPGVTVEKRTGTMLLKSSRTPVSILDLPGTYSLVPRSLDEKIVHNVLLGLQEETERPDLLLIILDANNLERNLYLASQAVELDIPSVFVLNMWDLARENGITIDLAQLEKLTGIPCVATVGNRNIGIESLREIIEKELLCPTKIPPSAGFGIQLPGGAEEALEPVKKLLEKALQMHEETARGEALRLLGAEDVANLDPRGAKGIGSELAGAVEQARRDVEKAGFDWRDLEAERRYAATESLCARILHRDPERKTTVSERIDSILTHQVWGLVFFAGFMCLIFQSIFSWAAGPMDMLSSGVNQLGLWAERLLPDGQLESLVVDGIIAGVGNVVVFLPQIFLLFFFIALMEDFGYMARAAFVLDRLMKRVGLNGKAFLPLLSSFACAIPGVMATRTIEDRNDRLATILVAPLMSCSARLPVYTLMIGAFIPAVPVLGIFDLKGVTLFAMYFLSILAGLAMASLFRKTFLKGNQAPFVFELPPYRIPNWKTIFFLMWDRGKEFLYRAGSIIFFISIILWFLVSYPASQALSGKYESLRSEALQTLAGDQLESRLARIKTEQAGERVRQSYAGRMGRAIEPVIEPLGYDWKIGIGLVASFAAREVLVSSLAIVYNVGEDADETSVDLIDAMRNEKSPVTGKPVYTPLVAVSLMVFFVLACQCMSTLAIVKRETNSWRWPLFMFAYMTMLAWGGAFLVFQTGRLLGWGL